MFEVKLQGGVRNAHQEFSVTLGIHVFNFEMDWRTRYEEWQVTIFVDDQVDPLVTDAVLNPGMNLLDGIFNYGRFYCYGEQPTLENIGIDSFLIWVSDDEIRR